MSEALVDDTERRVVDLVRKLSDLASGPAEAGGNPTTTNLITECEAFEGTEAARKISIASRGATLWHTLASEGLKPANIARGFSLALSSPAQGSRARLGVSGFYAGLLAMDGSPALGLFDEIAWSCVVGSIRTHFATEEGCVLVLGDLTKAVTERLSLNAFESSVTTTLETLTPLSREIRSKPVGDGDAIEVEVTEAWKESLAALYEFLFALVGAQSSGPIRRSSAVVLMRTIQPLLLLNVSNRRAPTKAKAWLRQVGLEFLEKFARDAAGDEEKTASKSVGALARHCCIKAPESAESRDHASFSVAKLVSFLPADQVTDFAAFLSKMFRHPQTSQRVFALEVAQSLTEECFKGGEGGSRGLGLDWTALLEGIQGRALDKAGFIRVKAINCLASIVSWAHCAAQGGEARALSPSATKKIVSLAVNRSRDSKPAVRKAALSLLECVLPLCQDIDARSIQAITSASHNNFVSVRKQAVVSASSLYTEFSDKEYACRMWLQVILPLALDMETSIQNKCKESFQKELLHSISSGGGEIFIRLLASESNFALLLRKVMSVTKLTRSQLAKVARVLQDTIQTLGNPSEEVGYWVVLSEVVAKHPSLLDATFIASALERVDQYLPEAKALSRMMQTIGNAAKNLNEDFALKTCRALTEKLRTFSVPVDAISPCLGSLNQLTTVLRSGKKTPGLDFLSEVSKAAEQLFKDTAENRRLALQEKKVASAVYTAGEVSLFKSFKVPASLVRLVQSMTSDRLSGSDIRIPQTILAHSWACLGKFCLRDETLAKRFIPLFFQEIKVTQISAVRNNIMLILADLCTKYTSLVDVHIGEIARCFDDPSEMVRRQTLIVLASLLQQDFLKWRGPIFHCFLLSLVDDSKSVQSLGNFLLSTSLSQKASLLAYNFFVQTLFALNGHNTDTNLAMEVESQALVTTHIRDLAGADEDSRQKRCVIYHHLLKRMTPEHKFQIAAKICEDCIGPFVEGDLGFDTHSEVLRDALVVLASKEIKADVLLQSYDGEEDHKLALAAAKSKLITAMMKKHLIGTIVPLIVELKGIFEAQKSPLLGILLNFACAVLKEHKEDVEDILVADNTFAKEVLYELQQEYKSRQPLVCHAKSGASDSPILKGNSFSTPVAHASAARSPLPVGTSAKTPLAAEVLQEEGMVTAKSVQANSEKKYLESARTLTPALGENGQRRKSMPGQETEVRRLSSLFNAAAEGL